MVLNESKKKVARLCSAARAAARKITLEPAIMLYAISIQVKDGIEVQTNLQLWKVC